MHLEAVHHLLSRWLEADKAGKHTSSQLKTFTPEVSAGRSAQPSSFRLDNFDALIMDQQPAVRDFLVQGFTSGFSLDRSDEGAWVQTEHANGQLSPEDAAMLQHQNY